MVAADVDRLRAEKDNVGEFVLGLYRLLHRIDADPALSRVLTAENEMTLERLAAFQTHDDSSVEELVALRGDFAEAMRDVPGAAELDDAEMAEPDFASHERWAYDFSLANFDAIAERPRELRYAAGLRNTSDPSRTSTLLNILSEKRRRLREAAKAAGDNSALEARLDELGRRLGNVVRRHEHAYHDHIIESRTLAGLAFGRLALIVNKLNPEPFIIESEEDEQCFVEANFSLVLSDAWTAHGAVFGGGVGDETYRRELMVGEALASLDRVVEALRWASALQTSENDGGAPMATPTVQIAGNISALAVAAGALTQNVVQQMVNVENYWAQLQPELLEAGLPDDEIQALKTALEEDAAGVDAEGTGGATRRYLRSLGRKVADGTVSVSAEVVAALITKYAGLAS